MPARGFLGGSWGFQGFPPERSEDVLVSYYGESEESLISENRKCRGIWKIYNIRRGNESVAQGHTLSSAGKPGVKKPPCARESSAGRSWGKRPVCSPLTTVLLEFYRAAAALTGRPMLRIGGRPGARTDPSCFWFRTVTCLCTFMKRYTGRGGSPRRTQNFLRVGRPNMVFDFSPV